MSFLIFKIINYIKKEYKFILINIFFILLFVIPLPYVIYYPGSITNISSKISVDNGYLSTGSINSTYVSSITPSLPFLILSFILPNWDVETQKSQVLKNEEYNEMENRSKIYLEEANSSAIIVALNSLKIPYKITKVKNTIIYIDNKNNNTLKLNDEIISIDNVIINNLYDISNYINTKDEGDIVNILVIRNNQKINCSAKVIVQDNQKIIGILLSTSYTINSDYNIKIKTDNNESGPSAGLMTSLAIYDALTIDDLTKGRIIAGTGTIDIDGNIGSIGGIKYKLIGAVKNKVNIFIVPIDNYEEAKKICKENKLKINVYPVNTFNDALAVLNNN